MKSLSLLFVTLAVASFSQLVHAQQTVAKNPLISEKQDTEIRALIEQLVFKHSRSKVEILYSPEIVEGKSGYDVEYAKQFDKCQAAFEKLSQLKGAAFPYLVEHLEDARPSIHFRNHYIEHSVGNACYWNLYFQLQDRPDDYSSYGYQRLGRDGKKYVQPYWGGTPFDEAGGLKKWLDQNAALSYPEKQIKCLQWLLAKEKEIGAPNAESYFRDILPLEIQILVRQQEAGIDTSRELERLREVLRKKDARDVPTEMLPPQAPR